MLLHIAKIARINLSPEEEKAFHEQFKEIFSLLERVKRISFEGEHSISAKNNLREDVVEQFDEDITAVFPSKKGRYLEVPKNL